MHENAGFCGSMRNNICYIGMIQPKISPVGLRVSGHFRQSSPPLSTRKQVQLFGKVFQGLQQSRIFVAAFSAAHEMVFHQRQGLDGILAG